MSVDRFRFRVLTVLGLPALACAKTPPPATHNGTPVLEIPVLEPVASATPEDSVDEELFTHPAAKAFDCGRDRTRAFVCGQSYGAPEDPAPRPYAQCSASKPQITQEVVIGTQTVTASFDSVLTARYQKHHRGDEKRCCYSACVAVDAHPRGSAAPPPGYLTPRVGCMTSLRGGTTQPAEGRADCAAAIRSTGSFDSQYLAPYHPQHSDARTKLVREQTGFSDLTLCCYENLVRRPPIMKGRALRDAKGQGVVAPTERSRPVAPLDDLSLEHLPPRDRAELAARWQHDAELEHASVAAFSRLSLALLALGAPPVLVAASHRAALDEIDHAQACYALASAYRGEALSPGPLPPLPPPTGDVVALAVDTFRDGCHGEAVAAMVAQRAAATCRNRRVSALLRRIAHDEERHALLGWRILRWTLASPGVREAVQAEALALRATRRQRGAVHESRLAAHGVLSGAEEAAVVDEVVTALVLPCVEALLAA